MNELALCVVNDGADYLDRLRTARETGSHRRFASWSVRVLDEAVAQCRAFDRESFTVAELAQAVVELDEYYQEHIKEFGA